MKRDIHSTIAKATLVLVIAIVGTAFVVLNLQQHDRDVGKVEATLAGVDGQLRENDAALAKVCASIAHPESLEFCAKSPGR